MPSEYLTSAATLPRLVVTDGGLCFSEKAGIYPLLDVDDMVAMRKPDWKCVFTYVQSIHRRFKDQS